MKILKTKKKKTTTEKITQETDLGFNIVETIINRKHQGVTLSCKDKDFQPVMLDLPKDWTQKYTEYYDLFDFRIEPKKVEDVKEDKIYYFYTDGHMLFDKNKKIVSIPEFFDYCESLRQKEPLDPIYAKLIQLLKKHPYVMSLEEEVIPYYNSEFGGQKGIAKAKVLLPQDKYEELYEKCKNDKFWSVRMTKHIEMHHGCTGVYGDEIDKLLEEYWKKEEM